jgi:hypothetical protein
MNISIEQQIQHVNLQNVASSTRKTYSWYQKKFVAWLSEKYPELFVQDSFHVDRLHVSQFQEFLLSLKTKKGQQPSYQTLNEQRLIVCIGMLSRSYPKIFRILFYFFSRS